MSEHSLHGQIALVTGASRGIGQAIADELARRGARVAGTATTPAGAEAIATRIGHGYVLDVRDYQSVETLVKTMTADLGAPGILVNNAGVTRDNLLMRMKDDEWESIIDTNLSSVYRLSKVLLRSMMKARYGRIVNITSVVGLTGNPGQTNYAAAKAGILGFTRSLAREVGSRGITVNAVAPGFIDTDMTRALSEAQRQALVETIPLSRLGSVQDVACAVAFLASAEAGYITGETLNVNGGMYMG